MRDRGLRECEGEGEREVKAARGGMGIFKSGKRKAEMGGFQISDLGLGIGHRERFPARGGKSTSTFSLSPCTDRRPSRQAFTLIELLGVAAVILPPMISKIEDARSTSEDANLEEIARALIKGITVSGNIPNPNLRPFTEGGWAYIAQNHTSLGGDALLYVFPPGNGQDGGENERRVYLDSTLMAYLASTAGSANVPFPTPNRGWTDPTPGGVPFPNQAMPMYIVSGSKRGLDLYCSRNQPGVMMNPAPQDGPGYGAGLIADLRSWVKAAQTTGANAGSIMVPSSIARWGTPNGELYRRGEYLHVKTVDLRPLFYQVTLRDYAAPPTAATVDNPAGGHVYPVNVGDPVDGIAFNYTYNFTPNLGMGNPFSGGEGGVFATPSSRRILINRTAVLTGFSIRDNYLVPLGNSTFTVTLPTPPIWGVVPPGVGGGNVMPLNANTQLFYVIKGTSLSLYPSGAPPPANPPVLTVQINADSSFEYFNGSWTRVD